MGSGLKNISKGLLLLTALSAAEQSWAQFDSETYEDYGAFATDPVELDDEVRDLMGRYFQLNFHFGTGIYTGGLGQAHAAGFLAGLRFILYFDRVWAVELSGSYGKNSAHYNDPSTVDVTQTTTLIPLSLAIRYGFDQKNLPRGLSLMNPYLVAGPELMFRSENIKDAQRTDGIADALRSKYTTGSINNSTGWAFAFGGGMEFDVYRKQLMLGLDVRYHLAIWQDGSDVVGNTGRNGHFITLLGHITYSY